jgi:hypothetical protein
MSILLLQIEKWVLEVKTHGDGFHIAMIEDDKPATSHYVRLDAEQSESLREFLNEASNCEADHPANEYVSENGQFGVGA